VKLGTHGLGRDAGFHQDTARQGTAPGHQCVAHARRLATAPEDEAEQGGGPLPPGLHLAGGIILGHGRTAASPRRVVGRSGQVGGRLWWPQRAAASPQRRGKRPRPPCRRPPTAAAAVPGPTLARTGRRRGARSPAPEEEEAATSNLGTAARHPRRRWERRAAGGDGSRGRRSRKVEDLGREGEADVTW
jgi:hypothetical protein